MINAIWSQVVFLASAEVQQLISQVTG